MNRAGRQPRPSLGSTCCHMESGTAGKSRAASQKFDSICRPQASRRSQASRIRPGAGRPVQAAPTSEMPPGRRTSEQAYSGGFRLGKHSPRAMLAFLQATRRRQAPALRRFRSGRQAVFCADRRVGQTRGDGSTRSPKFLALILRRNPEAPVRQKGKLRLGADATKHNRKIEIVCCAPDLQMHS